jgi:TonB family protein
MEMQQTSTNEAQTTTLVQPILSSYDTKHTPRAGAFLLSFTTQSIVLLLLLLFVTAAPIVVEHHPSFAVMPLVAPPTEQQPVPSPLTRPLPAPTSTASAVPVFQAPAVLQQSRTTTPNVAPPQIHVATNTTSLPALPVTPRSLPAHVETNVFVNGPSGNPSRPALMVQAAGFGDPNGVAPAKNGSAHSGLAPVGAFDGTGAPGSPGAGSSGMRAKLAPIGAVGFNTTPVAAAPSGRGPAVVPQSAFDQQAMASRETARKPVAERATVLTPVEIQSKPAPQYTEEARQLHIQGEVLLNVVFSATGNVRVVGVAKGLGHGLDEAAITAAQRIRFTPALRDGQRVDYPATLHIVFALS